jgi:hypothetical protein
MLILKRKRFGFCGRETWSLVLMEGLILGAVSLGIVSLIFTFGYTHYFFLVFAHFFVPDRFKISV